MKNPVFRLSLMAVLAAMCVSCLNNNIPYPRIPVNFTAFAVEGQTRSAQINTNDRVLTVYLGETVDPQAVHVTECSVTEQGEIVDNPFASGVVNLDKEITVVLRLYQDYSWVVRAVQDIERYFTVDGQVGAAVIDAPAHRVIVQIPTTADISKVRVLSAKLGPEGSVISPDPVGTYIDASKPVTFEVSAFGRSQTWTLYIEQTDALVTTSRADAWTRVAWIYGQALAGAEYGVEYRIKGDSEWTACPSDWISGSDGDYCARLTGLLPMTTYEARAVSGDETGSTVEFTTGEDLQLPNMMLDSWWKDGKVWCPWPEDGQQVWDTGNKGATTLGDSNTTPTDDTSTGSGQAARLETRFVGIGSLGKLAAGNIFVGKYVKTDGTNGILSMGHEFSQRPTRLTGYFKYTTAPISSTSEGFEDLAGRPDTCIVWIALTDADEPCEIRTKPSNRKLFDPEAADVIAYGSMQTSENVTGYTRFTITLDYRATNRTL